MFTIEDRLYWKTQLVLRSGLLVFATSLAILPFTFYFVWDFLDQPAFIGIILLIPGFIFAILSLGFIAVASVPDLLSREAWVRKHWNGENYHEWLKRMQEAGREAWKYGNPVSFLFFFGWGFFELIKYFSKMLPWKKAEQ